VSSSLNPDDGHERGVSSGDLAMAQRAEPEVPVGEEAARLFAQTDRSPGARGIGRITKAVSLVAVDALAARRTLRKPFSLTI